MFRTCLTLGKRVHVVVVLCERVFSCVVLHRSLFWGAYTPKCPVVEHRQTLGGPHTSGPKNRHWGALD